MKMMKKLNDDDTQQQNGNIYHISLQMAHEYVKFNLFRTLGYSIYQRYSIQTHHYHHIYHHILMCHGSESYCNDVSEQKTSQ